MLHSLMYTEMRHIRQVLVSLQSKLWCLDRLGDESSLFHPESCKLLLQTPDTDEHSEISEFIEELNYAAFRKDLGLYTITSPVDAAKLEKAAWIM